MERSASHDRVNDILLGPLERPALRWLAAHAPPWLTPNMCTTVGVFGSVVTLIGYLLSRVHPAYFWLATLGFVINWYGDSLDGTLARYRSIERPVYGFFIDHTTDAVTQVMVFIGLGLSPYVTFNVALLTLIGYLLMSVLVYVRTCVVAEFRISYGKLGPTEARVLAILLNTSMFFFGERYWSLALGRLGTYRLSPYDTAVAGIGLLLLYFFLSTAAKEGIRLYRISG